MHTFISWCEIWVEGRWTAIYFERTCSFFFCQKTNLVYLPAGRQEVDGSPSTLYPNLISNNKCAFIALSVFENKCIAEILYLISILLKKESFLLIFLHEKKRIFNLQIPNPNQLSFLTKFRGESLNKNQVPMKKAKQKPSPLIVLNLLAQ